MNKPYNNKAWLGVLPVLLIVAFSGVIPLMTVVNYSVQDILDFNSRFFVGFQWYTDTLQDPRFIDAFLRQLGFSASVLLLEIPLGLMLARGMPRQGLAASLLLVLLAIPLLIPWNVVGTIWQLFARSDIGLLGVSLNALGFSFQLHSKPNSRLVNAPGHGYMALDLTGDIAGLCRAHIGAASVLPGGGIGRCQ